MTADKTLAAAIAASKGCWVFVDVSDPWVVVRHAASDEVVYVRKVGEHGAWIIKNDADDYQWSGHDISKGLCEVDEHITRHTSR